MAEVTHTWDDDWNDVIRYVQFPDDRLKEMMAIPEEKWDNIQTFRDQYLVEDAMSDVLMTDEKVRICYYQDSGYQINNHVNRRLMRFDIFVKRDYQYNVDPMDRLKQRQKVIARRIRDLLTKQAQEYGLRFQYEDEYSLPTRMAGFIRYHIYFSYKITY